jgi:multiple sugar transport system substrate-binding protein
MRKFLALFLASVMLFLLLAACGEGGPGGRSASIEIEFWDMMWGPADHYIPAVEANVEKYNEENEDGINVTVQMTPWDNWYQVFLTAISAGAGPDVSTGAGSQPIHYAVMEMGLPLDSILDEWRADGNPILNDFVPLVMDYYNWRGEQWGIPWNVDPRALYYRTDLFEEAGITTLPRTFDEFTEVLRTIKDAFPDLIPLGFQAGDHFSMHVATGFLIYNGTGFVDASANANLEHPAAVEVWDYFRMLYEEGLIAEGAAGYRGADIELLSGSGEIVIQWGAPPTWLVGNADLYDKIGVMPPIAGPSNTGNAANYFWINGIQAYNNTSHPDESLAFLKWWAENTLTLFVDGRAGPSPARMSHYDNPFFQDDWMKREFYIHSIREGVPVVWPASVCFPAMMTVEGELWPGNVLRHILSASPDFESYLASQNAAFQAAIDEEGH